MPFNHARCLGATVLFRRNIPVDLRDRFGSGEIVRSLGHATPGEARRLVCRLWSRAEVDRIVSVALDGFRDDQDLAIAAIEPGVPAADRIDEPLNRSAYLNGLGALIDTRLETNDVTPFASITCLIPGFDGAIHSLEWKDALWARFCTEVPPRQRRSVERYNRVKRA